MPQLEGRGEDGEDSRSGPSNIRILNIPDLTTNYTFTSIDTCSLLSSMKGGGGEGVAWNKAVLPPPIFDNDRSFRSIQEENNKVLHGARWNVCKFVVDVKEWMEKRLNDSGR